MEFTEEVRVKLSGIIAQIDSDEGLKYVSTIALKAIKDRAKAKDGALIIKALAKYDEFNEVGKRIYTKADVVKLIGISQSKLDKAIKDRIPKKEETNDDNKTN